MPENVSKGSALPFAMIIEDDRDIVALFRHVLDLSGYLTEIILRGDKAVERLNITTPDIVILDLNLTGISGTEILKKIRSEDRLKDTPVIVVTGYPQMAAGLQADAELVLHKPVSIDQLSNLLKRYQSVGVEALTDHPYDEATRLYNRKFFTNRLSHSIEHMNRLNGEVIGILFIDCDNFRLVEQQGLNMASNILGETANVLKAAVRPYDTVAHFGSGQFFIQVEDPPSKEILYQISERVNNRLTDRIVEKFGYEMTVNIGMVFCGFDYQYPEEIIQDADIAMFYSKSNPYTNLVIFNPIEHGAFRNKEKYAAISRAGLPDFNLVDRQ